jgi:Ca2+-binding EF-hand superfamily protein
MMKTKLMLNGAALVALVLAGLSTAALADRGDRMGMGGDGPFPLSDFAAIDADKDGKITKPELEAFRAARVGAADADKDGKLSPAELKAQAMERASARADEMVARMIERHDSDGDGLISVAEMAAGPSPLDIFDRIDRDKDGAISQAEAEAARQHMAQRMGRHHGHGGPGEEPQN